MDPIHQFEITPLFRIGKIGPIDLVFTNSALFMLIAVAIIALLLLVPTASRALLPSRLQSIAEISYEFVADMIRSAAGPEGMMYFPLVFSLFMFILVANVVGLIPGAFTVTSQIIITAALALMVFLIVIVVGIARNGLRFFKIFVPPGVPMTILPLVVTIEVFSFIVRPLSHSVRLFANMLGAAGLIGWLGAALPVVMIVLLTALELLIAFLQAYVFAILTCIYLKDSLHPGH